MPKSIGDQMSWVASGGRSGGSVVIKGKVVAIVKKGKDPSNVIASIPDLKGVRRSFKSGQIWPTDSVVVLGGPEGSTPALYRKKD